jgi:intracellular multiplication protein IcmL
MSSNESSGIPASEERLNAMIQDRGASAHAALMRENGRLQLENQHQKSVNLRVWSAVGVQSLVLLIGIGSVFWWFPKYRFIATTDNKAICEVNSQSSVELTPAAVEEFAADAMVASYSYDYINYRATIDTVTGKWYTFAGRKGFMKALDDSGNLERVVKGRLIMRAFKTNAAQLESEGIEAGRKIWIVHVPIAIEFYVGGSPSPTSTHDFMAEVKVIETQATAANTKGTGVDNVVLRPRSRGK